MINTLHVTLKIVYSTAHRTTSIANSSRFSLVSGPKQINLYQATLSGMGPAIEKANLLVQDDKPAGKLRLSWLSSWTLW